MDTKILLSRTSIIAAFTISISLLFGISLAPASAADTSVSTARFIDVPQGHKFYEPITWMLNTGLTTGYADGGYHPKDNLTREAMAAFMYRQAGSPSFEIPTQKFIDVSPGHKFYKPIMWMLASGLSTGVKTPQGKAYQPKAQLSREAMAAFLYRSNDKPSYTSKGGFTDVKPGQKFFNEIAWMKQSGITTGYADGSFGPKKTVSREAMAAFIYRDSGSPGFVDTGSVQVTGNPVAKNTVTASAKGWGTRGVKLSYQWLLNGKQVAGATGKTFQLPADSAGKQVSVAVTGTLGKDKRTVTSPAQSIASIYLYGEVSVSGPSGRTFTANPIEWGPTGVKLAYQWLDWGKPIAGANGKIYTVPDDKSMNISVRLTGSMDGAKSRVAYSHYKPENGSGIQIDAKAYTLEQFREVYAAEVIRLVNDFRATVDQSEWHTTSDGTPIKPEPLVVDKRLKPNADFQTDYWAKKGMAWFQSNPASVIHNESGWKNQYPQAHPDGSEASPYMFIYENAGMSSPWEGLSHANALAYAEDAFNGWLNSPGHRDALVSQTLDAGSPRAWASVSFNSKDQAMFGNIVTSHDYRL